MKRALFWDLFLCPFPVWRPMVGPVLSLSLWVVELFLGHNIIYTPTPFLSFHAHSKAHVKWQSKVHILLLCLFAFLSLYCAILSLSLSLSLQLGLWGEWTGLRQPGGGQPYTNQEKLVIFAALALNMTNFYTVWRGCQMAEMGGMGKNAWFFGLLGVWCRVIDREGGPGRYGNDALEDFQPAVV